MDRLGLNGFEEIRNHAWFVNNRVDWNHLFDVPAPHVPKGSQRIRKALEEIKQVETGTLQYRQLIREITANFDEFKEGPTEGSTNNHRNNPLIQNSTDTSKFDPANANNAFEGYTFVRVEKVQLKIWGCIFL